MFCFSFHKKNGPTIQPPGWSGIVCYLSILVVFFFPTTIFELTPNTGWLCLGTFAIQQIVLLLLLLIFFSVRLLIYLLSLLLGATVLSPCPNQICRLIFVDLFMKHKLLLCERTAWAAQRGCLQWEVMLLWSSWLGVFWLSFRELFRNVLVLKFQQTCSVGMFAIMHRLAWN